MKIIVGVDGSSSAARAIEWCASYAGAMHAEVVAVFSIEMPTYAASGFGYLPIPVPSEPDREAIGVAMQEWCAPLARAKVPFEVVVMDGAPAPAIMAIADREQADLVVTGRRGHGGFAGLLLGSTSNQLAHHVGRPLVIVP